MVKTNSIEKLVGKEQAGNRASLLASLRTKVKAFFRYDAPIHVFLLKLDNFSKIDKNRGQLGTSCVVKTLKERLCLLMQQDVEIYQLNADRFAMLYTGNKLDFTATFIEQILKKLRQPVTFYYDIITVELSLGFIGMQPEISTAEELLKRAEIALKLAQSENARWRDINCQQCKFKSQSDRELFIELKQSIADVELHLAGQPIYNFDTGELTIVEVLLRWHHDQHGPINPLKIIELAGKNGYLYYIAVYVCQQLAEFLVNNKSKYQSVSFSINFNMPQIINKKLIEHVFAIFDHNGIDRSRLIFESTETDALPVSFEDAAGHFHWIRKQGVQVAMDDFGSGYSTLALLSTIDVDLIKIDRSLVFDIEHNSRRLETLLSVLQLCQRLDLSVVIEGVENEQQHQLLLECNISNLLVQGYFYGKPKNLHQHEFSLQTINSPSQVFNEAHCQGI